MVLPVFLFLGLLISPVLASAGDDDIDVLKQLYLRPSKVVYPPSNPHSKDKENLGKILFFDPRLSASGTQSCATCHSPSLGWEDGMAKAVGHGHKKLARATPTILNLAWDHLFFWDGRVSSLEEQALIPIVSKEEMNMTGEELLTILQRIPGYRQLFKRAFPGQEQPINLGNVSKAIATYERGIVSGKAPFDHWVEGDEGAISQGAKRGFALFNTKANCAACHSGWQFSDSSFHDIGMPSDDLGRGKFIPHLVSMQHAFKTMGLRNIEERAPYMHDGSQKTLGEVIDHYDGGFVERESLSDEIKMLDLTLLEKADLISFLKTLTSKDQTVTVPLLPK